VNLFLHSSDAASRVSVARTAVGTAVEQVYARFAQMPNGKQLWSQDPKANHTPYLCYGFDRLSRTQRLDGPSLGASKHAGVKLEILGQRSYLRESRNRLGPARTHSNGGLLKNRLERPRIPPFHPPFRPFPPRFRPFFRRNRPENSGF
jgi:hypothetical protein